MGVFHRAAKREDMSRNSYDDTVNMVTNVGVIAALALSFVVACLSLYSADDFNVLDFRQLYYTYDTSFQEFVVFTLESQGTNLTVELTKGDVFDIRDVITSKNCEQDGNRGCLRQHTARDEMALAYIVPAFPMDRFQMWLATHSVDAADLKSGTYYFQLIWATVFLVISLLGSLMPYFSLAMSPAVEDATGRFLRSWNRYGTPLILLMAFFSLVGLVCFLFSIFMTSVFFVDRIWRNAGEVGAQAMLGVVTPAMILLAGVSLRLYCVASGFNETEKAAEGDIEQAAESHIEQSASHTPPVEMTPTAPHARLG